MSHPAEGEIPQLGFPYKFSKASPSARLRPPLLGEHTEAILNRQLGLSDEEIKKLIAENVVVIF